MNLQQAMITLALFMGGVALVGAKDAQIDSWAKLEIEIGGDFVSQATQGIDTAMSNPVFKTVADKKDIRLFLEMADQYGHPIVVLAGIYCIQRIDPKLAISTIIKSISQCDTAFNPAFSPLFPMISSLQPTPDNIAAFQTVMASSRIKRANLSLLLSSIPVELLEAIWKSRKTGCCSATVDSVLISQIGASRLKRKLPPDTLLDESILGLQNCPGYPRIVFLQLCNPNVPDLLSVLKEALAAR